MKIFSPLLFVLFFVVITIAASPAAVDPAAPSESHPRMEVVFALDTTGSMGSMIEGAKRKIWAIAGRLKSAQPTPEIRFGLVAYRDHGDAYVTEVFPLSHDLDEVYGHLMGFAAAGGGDTPEAVNEALDQAVNGIQWTNDKGVLRVIFLIGDAPPHMDYTNDVKWDVTCQRAKAKGILINGLQCGSDPETAQVWREISSRTGGRYTVIVQDNRTADLNTRYDADIVGINRALRETVIPYGADNERLSATKSGSLLDVMTAEGVADRSSFLDKDAAGSVLTGRGDLVGEILAGRITFDKIDASRLDSDLRARPAAERDQFIRRQVDRRQNLMAGLKMLLEKRNAAVDEQLKSAKDSGELIILSPFEVMIGEAESHGYHFEKK